MFHSTSPFPIVSQAFILYISVLVSEENSEVRVLPLSWLSSEVVSLLFHHLSCHLDHSPSLSCHLLLLLTLILHPSLLLSVPSCPYLSLIVAICLSPLLFIATLEELPHRAIGSYFCWTAVVALLGSPTVLSLYAAIFTCHPPLSIVYCLLSIARAVPLFL